ncbi:Oidioi.mRNA.OKI2018_I69.PAR.g8475.t1.cds [Oikopleura dioica]|uniref:Oidioi.mRNA.OKI2018_I69.PAR.g8475.t1.cds n=1 Tax=Oikopleura dioica TaxID=34765 RepID=A0ABN7RKD9_OIKDI|nr:Oidioi.mRNA.OKI2018_I69.PAR.g8475.t1.cds [Oikopleura dioica]
MIVTAGHYIARQNLNFTITVMTDPPAEEFTPVCSSEDISGPEISPNSSDIFNERKKYDWTTAQYGYMLGAFYIGYCAAVFPGALVAQKFGFHPTILFVCFGNALASFFFPILVDYSFAAGIFSRILLGLTSGPIMPSIQGAWYWWGCPEEITINIAIQSIGVTLGNCFGAIGTGLIIQHFNWQLSFYLSGLMMFLVGLLWLLMVDPIPEKEWPQNLSCLNCCKISARMTEEEKILIKSSRPPAVESPRKGSKKRRQKRRKFFRTLLRLRDMPIKSIISDPQLYIISFIWFAMSYVIYSATNNTPTYLRRVHGLPIQRITFLFGIISVSCLVVNVAIAIIADRMRKIMSSTFVRKTWTAGMGIIFLPSVVLVNFLGCDAKTIEFCLAVFVVCASTASTIGLKPLTADISGNYASVIFGFVNFIGNFAGFAAPRIMAFFLTGKNQGEPESWDMVFALPAGVFTIALGIFIAFGTAETRSWALTEKKEDRENGSNCKVLEGEKLVFAESSLSSDEI